MQKESPVYNIGAVAVSTGAKPKKTHVVGTKISSTDSFQDVLTKLCTVFKVQDATSMRVGQLKSASVTDFGGTDFGTYIKSQGLFPSQIKLYLETNQKFAVGDVPVGENLATGFEDDEGEVEDKLEPVKKKAKESAAKAEVAMEAYRLDVNDVVKKELVGKGGMAEVYRGTWKGTDVAIKACRADNNQQAQQLAKLMESELEIHLQVSHRNVLPLIGFCKTGTDVLMVAELMHCSLDKFLYPEEGQCQLGKEKKMFLIKEMLW